MCFERNPNPSERITFKVISISWLLGGLFWSFSKWQVLKHRVDFWPLQLGAFSGLIFANYLWSKYKYEIQKQLVHHKFILKNKNQIFLEPSLIPFMMFVSASISIASEMISFIKKFLLVQHHEIGLPPRTRGWDFWSDYFGGFTIVLFIYLGFALLRWAYIYKQTHHEEAAYAIPPK